MNNKGQALLELAILGAVLILLAATFMQWGMAQNNNQRLEMDAFRLAYYLNEQTGAGDSGNTTTLVLINDLPRPDIQNKYGIMERSPQMASASVTRSINLMGTPNYDDQNALPTIILKIGNSNKKNTSYSGFSGGILSDPQMIQLTTAAYKEYDCPNSDCTNNSGNWRKQVSIKNYKTSGATTCWQWNSITVDQGSVSGTGTYITVTDPKLYYTDENGDQKELKEGGTADFKGSGKEQLLLKIVKASQTAYHDVTSTCCDTNGENCHDCTVTECVKDSDGNCMSYNVISGVQVMDYQEGQIDLTAKAPKKQSYKGEYLSQITGASASVTRDKTGVTASSVSGTQGVTHYINVQPKGSAGGTQQYSVENDYDVINAN